MVCMISLCALTLANYEFLITDVQNYTAIQLCTIQKLNKQLAWFVATSRGTRAVPALVLNIMLANFRLPLLHAANLLKQETHTRFVKRIGIFYWCIYFSRHLIFDEVRLRTTLVTTSVYKFSQLRSFSPNKRNTVCWQRNINFSQKNPVSS